MRCAQDYGDIVHIRYVNQHHYMINHPQHIQRVLVDLQPSLIKWRPMQMIGSFAGKGLAFNDGEVWKRQRRLMQPAFHGDRLQEYASVMVDHATRVVDQWQPGSERDLHYDAMLLAMNITYSTLFGVAINDDAKEVGANVLALERYFQQSMTSNLPLPPQAPTPRHLRMRAHFRRIDRVLFRIIAERRRSAALGHDILSTLIEGRDEDGSGMTDQEIRDEVSGLLIAGYDTAALTLTWTLYLLSQHPEVEEKVLAEILAACGGRRPTKSDLPALRYTHSVITESLRLYPPAYAMGREATCDLEVGDYRIPKGGQLFMTPWVVHRDPRFYDEPEMFRPERWLEPAAAALPRYAYFPFGGGPHKCIGAQFGMMEVMLILAVILPRVRLSIPSGRQVTPLPEVFLQPSNGLRMHVALREPAAVH